VEGDAEVSHASDVAFFENARRDSLTVDPGSVVRTEILQRRSSLEERDARVMAAHQIAEKDDVVRGKPAEGSNPFSERERRPVVSWAVNDDVGLMPFIAHGTHTSSDRPVRLACGRLRGRVRLATLTLLASVLCLPSGFAQEQAQKGIYRATTDRLAMRFGFYSPSGRVGSVDLSEVNRWVAASVEENTDLDVSELDGQVVDRCVESSGARKRLTCLVEESSEEWIAMRSSLPQSFSEVRNRLRASRTHPRYVLILSATSVEGGDRIAVLLIDVEDALMRVHARRSKPNPPSPEDLAAIEDEISK
jgi:hypothetical protein